MPENLNPEHQLEYLKELRKKYEAVLADAQKTGDYTEATKLKDELDQRLTALEAQFPKPEAKKESAEFLDSKFEEKALEEYEKYFKWGVGDNHLLIRMAGFNSDKAMDLRSKLMDVQYPSSIILLAGLAGVDNERSWQVRNSYNINDSSVNLLMSLAGLDSERAWDLRLKILGVDHSSNIDDMMALSLTGLDSDRAWSMRYDLLKRQRDSTQVTQVLLQSVAGINSTRAWDMRTALYTQEDDLPFLVSGLVGIDSGTAWANRYQLENKIRTGVYPGKEKEYEAMLAKSLAGVDSEPANAVRTKWEFDGKRDLVALSLAGLDNVFAWEVRNSLEEDVYRRKLEKLDVLNSINGDPTTAIGWRTARQNQKKQP